MTGLLYAQDELLLRWIVRESQRSRFVRQAEDRRRVLAQRVVDDVAGRLTDQGHYVTYMRNNDPFDLLVDGLRVEVKAATWSKCRRRYQAAMRGNRADVLIFGCVPASGRSASHQKTGTPSGDASYFVIPFDQVQGVTNIAIWQQDVRAYAGRWRPYLEAWPLIGEMIRRGVNHWQMSLWRGKRG